MYKFYASITVDNTKVSGASNHASFPVLVSGTYDGTSGGPDIRTVANGGKVQNTASGGVSGTLTVPADLVFSPNKDGSSKYDFEIQSYDATTGAIIAWVRIPSLLTASDTVFYMSYGDSSVSTPQENVNGVWDNNYELVAHLTESGNGTDNEYKDSTSNGNHGQGAGNIPTQYASGKIGIAQDFDGSGDYIDFKSPATLDNLPATAFTLSLWINLDWNTDIYRYMAAKRPDIYSGFAFGLNPSNDTVYTPFGFNPGDSYDMHSEATQNGVWYHMVETFNFATGDKKSHLFVNGHETIGATAASGTYRAEAASNLILGKLPENNLNVFDGKIDEFRISSIARDADWNITEYNNQNSPSTFYAMGLQGQNVFNPFPSHHHV